MGVPISSSITIRPVWARRQQRFYRAKDPSRMPPPTPEEIHDAIVILSDPKMQFEAPALYIEAERIHQEATEAA